MVAHSSTLAWKIPWMEEPDRLQSMGWLSQTLLSDFTFTFHFHALEKEMATHSSVLAWRIPVTGAWWAAVCGVAQSQTRLSDFTLLFTFMHWRRKWQPTPVFLPGESQGWEPGGLPSVGSHRVGHDWRDLAAAATSYAGKVECSFSPFKLEDQGHRPTCPLQRDQVEGGTWNNFALPPTGLRLEQEESSHVKIN